MLLEWDQLCLALLGRRGGDKGYLCDHKLSDATNVAKSHIIDDINRLIGIRVCGGGEIE